MGSRTFAIDAWQTTTHNLVDRTVDAILDACHYGPSHHRQPVRDPSAGERDRTDRRDGNFHPTPPGANRRADVSRPTESAVLASERTWQQASGRLYHLATEWNRHPHPDDPPRDHDSRGHLILEGDVRACRRTVHRLGKFLHQRTDQIADEMRPVADDRDAFEFQVGVGQMFARRLETLRRQWDPDRRTVPACLREGCWRPRWKAGICRRCYEDPRPCQCGTGCGRTVERGDGRWNPSCRKRRERENAA
jgi:hypothetical protein